MASTKESNTSKTAHVMNLLSRTRGGAASPPESAADAPTAESVAAPAASPQIPPILSSMEADAAVSTQIKDALEDALTSSLEDAEEPAPPPAAEIPSASPDVPLTVQADSEEVSQEPPSAMQWPELESENSGESSTLSQPPVQTDTPVPPQAPEAEPPMPAEPIQQQADFSAPEPQQTAPPPEPPVPEPSVPAETAQQEADTAVSYVNIMEVLVEERAGKYMEMFGMCQCERCKVDVKALALNSLPSKYVVMGKGEFVPRITVYEGRFSAAVTAQLLRACKIVMDTPRHSPQNP